MDLTKEFDSIITFYFTYIVCYDNYFSIDLQRKTNLLYPPFKRKINTMLDRYLELDNSQIPKIFETYRSLKRQKELYNENKTKIMSAGFHHFGLAADIVFLKDNQITWEGNYNMLNNIAFPIGLFKTGFNEQCHYQYYSDNILQQLRVYAKTKVIRFQQMFKLKDDGIIGPVTKQTMFHHYWGKSSVDMQMKVRNCDFNNNIL